MAKVLLVEDSPTDAYLTMEALKNEGVASKVHIVTCEQEEPGVHEDLVTREHAGRLS